MLKTIIFDFGGVMVNDRSSDQTLTDALNRLPLDEQKKHKKIGLQSELGKIPYDEFWESDKQLFPNMTLEEIKQFFLNTEVYQPFYIAEKLLAKYQVIIFSNNHKGAPEEVAKYLNINISRFPFINSALVGMRKPEKKFYDYLVEKYNLTPADCIFIDNTSENLVPAKNLGMTVFHYTKNDKALIDFLKNHGIENF